MEEMKRQARLFVPDNRAGCFRFALQVLFSGLTEFGARGVEEIVEEIPLVPDQAYGGYFREWLVRAISTPHTGMATQLLYGDMRRDLEAGKITIKTFEATWRVLQDLAWAIEHGLQPSQLVLEEGRLRMVS